MLRWQCLKTRHPLLAILREYLAILLQELRLHGGARRVRGIRRTEIGAPRSGVERGAFRPRPDMVALDTTPAIVDAHGERRLQFSDDALQSKMRLDDPQALIAPYTRQMLSCLLFDPDPAHVLLIGLGGGSQAKFCYRYLPRARITAVEIDARVIALRERFEVPADDARFRVVHDEGARYLAHTEEPVDAILVDAFDAEGVSPALASPAFFRDVARVLTPAGVLVMNLHGDPQRFGDHLQHARAAFDTRAFIARVTANDNLLLYALGPHAPAPTEPHLFLRARYLQSKMPLHFRHYLEQLQQAEPA